MGVGWVHGNNECCADSLLQLLSRAGFVEGSLATDVSGRRKACSACRAHLINHENEQLHPKQRTSTGAVASVSDAEHDAAFLQHDVHAEAIVRFFVEMFSGVRPLPVEGLHIGVFTRWDSPMLPAENNSVFVCQTLLLENGQRAPPTIVLEMYNNTGSGFTGYHYDPIFNNVGVAPESPRNPSTEACASSARSGDFSCPPPPPPHEMDRPRKRLRQKTSPSAPVEGQPAAAGASH